MLKKTLLIGASVLVLSGCSLPPLGGKGAAPGSTPGSFWKSSDGGATFEPKVAVSTAQGEQKITSADILTIAFHPKEENRMYIGTVGSGIFETKDGAEKWESIKFPPQKIYSFSVDRKLAERMFATGAYQGQGKMYRSDDAGANWKEMYTEPNTGTVVTSLAEHPKDTHVLFAGTSAGTVLKSTDSGDTWRNIGNQVEGPVTEIVFDAQKPLSLYLLTHEKKIYFSRDGGNNWLDWEEEKEQELQRFSQQSNNQKAVEALREKNRTGKMPSRPVTIVADPGRPGVIYTGTAKGLFRSDDYGKYWTELNVIESAKRLPIRSVAIHPKNSQEFVFVSGTAFYKTTNGGTTWNTVDLAIDRDASVVQYDPFHPANIYIGLRTY